MVKLRHIQPTHLKKKDETQTRTLLSFSNFRHSFTAPNGVRDSIAGRIPSSVEIANAYKGESVMKLHVERRPLQRTPATLGLSCPDANTNSQIARVLKEISNSAKQDEEPSPATQLAAAFNRWRYSHLKVEQRLHMELLKAINRAQRAEFIIEEKDMAINTLREELKKVEEEKCQMITKLQEDIAILQHENDCCYHEVKNAMDQLAGIDGHLPSQPQKRSSLGSYLGKQRKKHAKEVKERVNFSDERDLSKVDFSLEEVGMTLHCQGSDKPKAPKAVSLELEQHLKRLTSYVRNLEACILQGGHNVGFERRVHHQQQSVMHNLEYVEPVDPVTLSFETSDSMQEAKTNENSQSRSFSTAGVKKSSYFLHSGCELNMPRESTQKLATLKQQPYLYQNQKMISWSQSHSREKTTAVTTVDTQPEKFTNLLSRCISWKWRWAAAASQLKALSKELQNMTIAKENKNMTTSEASANRDKFITSMQKLGFIHVQNLQNSQNSSKGRTVTAKSKQKEAKFSVSGHKVISIMLSMWRASIKNAKLEKEAVCNGEKLSRLLAGLPWLIQKFEERRHLERMFYHWALHMLRAKVQIYYTSMHQSGAWPPTWQKRPPSSLWVAQLGSADLRTLEGNGYQGRYMRYTHLKPNERQQVSTSMRKSSCKSPERSDSLTTHLDCVNESLSVWDADVVDGFSCELSSLSQKDNRHSLRLSKNPTTPALNAPPSNKTASGPDNNAADEISWSQKHNVTSFTEKAMQALQVSLYNELQKLQELIVREARSHQEKVGEKEDSPQDGGGSNASPFSTSLWRICNGLAHCLIEARNQILALAGNSDTKSCQKAAAGGGSKPYIKAKRPANLPMMLSEASDNTYQKTRFRFLRRETKCKKKKASSKDVDFQLKQEAADADILEFVGEGKGGDEVKASQRGHI